MTTARDLTQAVLEEIGVYGPGESIGDADAQRVLDQLIKMLDIWSLESLACYAILEQSKILIVNQASYTIGKSGVPDINATRPLKIMQGRGRAFIRDSGNVNYPVDVVERDVWNLIGQRTQTSQIPNTLFYDPQYPNGVINLFPVPTIAYTLYFDSMLQLNGDHAAISSLDSTISFPPGYEGGIQHNLAVWCGPFFKNALVSQDVKDLASQTKRVIKRVNKRTITASFDKEISARGAPTYNVYTDNYGR